MFAGMGSTTVRWGLSVAIAQTIGIEMPSDFPTVLYNAVAGRLGGRYQSQNPVVWGEYAGGWNAVAIRFRTTAGADERFTASIKRTPAPPHDERQAQEEDLFAFFVNGYAAIESFCYAAFALGALLQPADFPMSSDGDLQAITPGKTQQKYAAHCAGSPLDAVLSGLVASKADPAYRNWGRIRNVLAHRAAPGRIQHAHIHEGPGAVPTPDQPAEWKMLGGLTLDERTTADRRKWLAGALAQCVRAADAFTQTHFQAG
jgi:hypothetical protein